ncbi:MAG: hypothetical protein AAGE88_22595 [Actinomycetota bacterium]
MSGDSGGVRVVVLSDQAEQELAELQREHDRALYQEEVWRTRLRTVNREIGRRRRTGPLWQRLPLFAGPEERALRAQADLASNAMAGAAARRQSRSRELARTRAGERGAETLVAALATLPDRWVALRGYSNAIGATDLVLVGPGGVWALDAWSYNARLYVDGARWWLERVDGAGHATHVRWATDADGRSWGRQVAEVATDLGGWLATRGQSLPVRTAVILVDAEAGISRLRDPEVDLVTTDLDHLIQTIRSGPTMLGPSMCRSLVEGVIGHHRSCADERRRAIDAEEAALAAALAARPAQHAGTPPGGTPEGVSQADVTPIGDASGPVREGD